MFIFYTKNQLESLPKQIGDHGFHQKHGLKCPEVSKMWSSKDLKKKKKWGRN
jgi:hypothetical protein